MAENTQEYTLIVFVKYPEPGRVKTRLAKEIGVHRAAKIYSYMAQKIVEEVSESDNYLTTIYFDPAGKEEEIKDWLGIGNKRFRPQSGTDLGERISRSFEEVISLGTSRAVIIGTDCIDVTRDIINRAFEALNNVDFVVGPAQDGGYYLLGLKHLTPDLFINIEWSTEHVLEQTLEKLKENSLSYQLLETLSDIDDPGDLHSLDLNRALTG